MKRLDEEQQDVQQQLQGVEQAFRALLESARDVGELRRCGAEAPDTAAAARDLEQGFARLAVAQHALQEYVRAAQGVRAEIARFAAEHGDVAEDADGPQQQELEALLARGAEQLARFADAADTAKDPAYDHTQHPLYAQFAASLSVCSFFFFLFLSPLISVSPAISLVFAHLLCADAGKRKRGRGRGRHCRDAQQGERHLSHHPQAHRQACEEVCCHPLLSSSSCTLMFSHRACVVVAFGEKHSPVCGHCYSSAAVREWVAARQSGVVRCPVAGCEAVLRLSGLQPATDVEHELLRLQLRPTPEELAQQQDGPGSQHAPAPGDGDVVDL